jgi:hypothetical protein
VDFWWSKNWELDNRIPTNFFGVIKFGAQKLGGDCVIKEQKETIESRQLASSRRCGESKRTKEF